MATICKVFKNEELVGWQVKFRRVGAPTFTLSFSTYERAADYANENEWEYLRDPKKYLRIDRLEERRKREREKAK